MKSKNSQKTERLFTGRISNQTSCSQTDYLQMGEKFVVPDADTLIRLAEILEVSVSELLGTKIENENVASDVAEQLSRINEQLAIKNRRSRRIWKIVAIILAVIVLVNIFIAVFFSVPDLNSNTQNNPLAISDETISIDE